jgi:hypothetical protein
MMDMVWAEEPPPLQVCTGALLQQLLRRLVCERDNVALPHSGAIRVILQYGFAQLLWCIIKKIGHR